MKYVMFESLMLGVFPIVFPDHIDHAEVAKAIQCQLGAKPCSAGFCNSDGDTFGNSSGLKMVPACDDNIYLHNLLTL